MPHFSQLKLMFVRAKKVGPRRYAYLVKGVREGGRVRQRTLSYLGPVSKLAFSDIPDATRRKVEKRFQVDWNRISAEIARIPLTFEELSEARRARYAISARTRQAGFRSQGRLPRAEGELAALTRLARARFGQMFEQVGDREYRMR